MKKTLILIISLLIIFTNLVYASESVSFNDLPVFVQNKITSLKNDYTYIILNKTPFEYEFYYSNIPFIYLILPGTGWEYLRPSDYSKCKSHDYKLSTNEWELNESNSDGTTVPYLIYSTHDIKYENSESVFFSVPKNLILTQTLQSTPKTLMTQEVTQLFPTIALLMAGSVGLYKGWNLLKITLLGA